jgi:hypothetical protein
MVERFRRPDVAFMLIESEYADDKFSSAPSSMTLNTVAPGWTTPDWHLSFRHTLPPDSSLYQKQATTSIAFIDGHVTYFDASPGVGEPVHWTLKASNAD